MTLKALSRFYEAALSVLVFCLLVQVTSVVHCPLQKLCALAYIDAYGPWCCSSNSCAKHDRKVKRVQDCLKQMLYSSAFVLVSNQRRRFTMRGNRRQGHSMRGHRVAVGGALCLTRAESVKEGVKEEGAKSPARAHTQSADAAVLAEPFDSALPAAPLPPVLRHCAHLTRVSILCLRTCTPECRQRPGTRHDHIVPSIHATTFARAQRSHRVQDLGQGLDLLEEASVRIVFVAERRLMPEVLTRSLPRRCLLAVLGLYVRVDPLKYGRHDLHSRSRGVPAAGAG